MVQDPNFWRRFSVAVHNSEAAALSKETSNETREIKHAYVVSLSSPIASPATTPTSQCHLSPAFPAAASTRPFSAPAIAFTSQPKRSKKRESRNTSVHHTAEEKTPELIALHHVSSRPLPALPSTPKTAHFPPQLSTPPSKRTSRRASRFKRALTSHPPSLPPTPLSTHFPPTFSSPSAGTRSKRTSRFTSHRNGSRLSLGLSFSGRPKSSFKFWTTITADASNSDSWLEGQIRKKRQRTWLCWAFWLVFLVVVGGGIVALVVLSGRGII